MRYLENPLTPERAKLATVLGIGSIAVVVLMTLPHLDSQKAKVPKWTPVEVSNVEDSNQPLEDSTLDIDPFDIELWRVPMTREAVPSDTISERAINIPIRLTLIGITEIDGEKQAALYDPIEDRLYLSRPGEKVGKYKLDSIAMDSVTLVEGNRKHPLEMKRADHHE